jgi:hypothetical protein
MRPEEMRELLRKAKEELAAISRYEQPVWQMPKVFVRLSLCILSVGFLAIGLACLSEPISAGAGFLVGGTFFAIAVII